MSIRVPESHVDLLTGPYLQIIITLMPDGQPQASVVAGDYDGTHIRFTAQPSRQKIKNLQANPKVTVMVTDPKNIWRYIEVRGEVDAITKDGMLGFLDGIAMAYAKKPKYYGSLAPAELEGKEDRIMVRIRPTKVNAYLGQPEVTHPRQPGAAAAALRPGDG